MWGEEQLAGSGVVSELPEALFSDDNAATVGLLPAKAPGEKFSTIPPIAILGVPFHRLTLIEVVAQIEKMIATRQPHYLVTANVDFLVQAQHDVELRRILLEAHQVLCDGTPLLWASRLLGNALPERVAGADLVPHLIQLAAEKNYRIFFLGGTPEVAQCAVANLQKQFPSLIIAGHYSPPFRPLLEMDHEEIRQRVRAAQPDMLFVSFGCPKAEKWMAMHYRALEVPVAIGVGGTIDFLAGRMKRAPVWMQRCGTEWIYRLGQEPRRLYRRYAQDFWKFGFALSSQWWQLGLALPEESAIRSHVVMVEPTWKRLRAPGRFDKAALLRDAAVWEQAWNQHCILDLDQVKFIDSTAIGMLIELQKQLQRQGFQLVLLDPSAAVRKAFGLMKLEDTFSIAPDIMAARERIVEREPHQSMTFTPAAFHRTLPLIWRGEITAHNADEVWMQVEAQLHALAGFEKCLNIDLSGVPFIDSTGVGLLARAKKFALNHGLELRFSGVQPNVRNVLQHSRQEGLLLGEQL